MRTLFKKNMKVGRRDCKIEILFRDSKSDPTTAALMADELIANEGIHLMLVAGTPATANPVSDRCESNGVPCISTMVPWPAWFYPRGGQPDKGFKWTFHYFFGLEDIVAVYMSTWRSARFGKNVGVLYPNDPDGNAFSGPFLKALQGEGYRVSDPGKLKVPIRDFSDVIARFKKDNVDIVTGVLEFPDAKLFIEQSRTNGFKPKAITLAKALLFEEDVASLGGNAVGLTTEVFWSENFPFKSALTGESSRELAQHYKRATGKSPDQGLGYILALFEIAVAALATSSSLSRKDIRDALIKVRVDTIVGSINWRSNFPVPNVCSTPLVGGQWKQGKGKQLRLEIVENSWDLVIPKSSELIAL